MESTVRIDEKVKRTKQAKQTQPTLTFKQWVLKAVKIQKKRTSRDSITGLIITAVLFLITLM
ncbi:hypothetical protein AV656_09170 [Bhargavaea cecembensis]|uniref:Uncharacterized protein n=1 Tax=Bhargavaea cecembensis TaxID=394098 RepID=A0A163F100_9BACL|nr:hypothetical protein [Bhargavaea cecembensis]KZE37696.1 hypothetical protein AV656_09170 [Bhargavaea cecembensis]